MVGHICSFTVWFILSENSSIDLSNCMFLKMPFIRYSIANVLLV